MLVLLALMCHAHATKFCRDHSGSRFVGYLVWLCLSFATTIPFKLAWDRDSSKGECSKTLTVVSRLPRQPIRSCLRGAPSAPLTVSFSSGTFNCTHTPPSETVTAVLPKGLQRSGSLLHTGGPVNAKRTRNIDSYSHVRHCPSSFFYGSDHLLGKGRLAAKAV